MSYPHLLAAVLPVFLIIAAGCGLRRAGSLTAEADGSLLRLVVNVLFPCLILRTILGNRALENPANLLLAPPLGAATILVGLALSYALAPAFGVRAPRARRAFAFATGLYNYGYIPLPLVQQLFADQGTMGVLMLFNVGVETTMWTVGLMLLSGTPPREAWRHVLSVPVLAMVVALGLNGLGARAWLPEFLLATAGLLGAMAVPMGLLLVGATLADEMRSGGEPLRGRPGLGACLLRVGLLPAGMLALAKWLPLSPELRRVLVVQAAMPSAVIPILLVRHYGADPAVALRVVLATSALGLVTIPLWLRVGLSWLGP